jgi:peptidyl-prolyl cis-trans isomerase C
LVPRLGMAQGPVPAPSPAVVAAPAAVPARSPEETARRSQALVKAQGGIEITLGELEDFLAAQPPMMRERYRSVEEQKRLLENLLRMDLLAAEAARKGYDKNPAVVRTVKDSSVQALLRSEIDAKFSPQSLPAADVKAYYDANAAEFHREAMRRSSQIVVATEDEAKKLLAEAQKADVRAFAELAKQHSLDAETKMRGGDLGYFTKEPKAGGPPENVAPAVRAATFALKAPGDMAPKPVQLDSGFAIVRLTGERPERHTELAEADLTIRTKLWREKRQKALTELVDGLKARDKPQVFTERADWIKFDDMDKRPPGFAPDRPPGGPRPAPAAVPGAPAAPGETP